MATQKRLKVLYHCLHGGTRQQLLIHERLVSRGFVEEAAAFVTYNAFWRRFIHRRFPGAPVELHPNLLDLAFRRPASSTIEPGSREERLFVRGWKNDRNLLSHPRASVEPLWVLTLERMNRFLDETKPQVILTDGIQSLPCYALFVLAEQRKIPYLQLMGARLGSRRVEIHADVSGRPVGLFLDRVPAAGTRKWAEEYLASVRAKAYAGPAYMKDFRGKKIRFGKTDLVKTATYLTELAMGGALEPTRGKLLNPFIAKFRAIGLSKQLNDASLFKTLEDLKAAPGQKVLFPLHVTPEASTLTWAPRYSVMGDVVEMLSRNLPEGWTLAVKEHPSITTLQRSAEERERIRGFRNVVYLSPFVANRDLYEVCPHLVVINSTLGMEAMLEGRAVVTLGKPFYDATGNTVPCERAEDLEKALLAAESKVVDQERNLNLLTAYYDCTGEGFYGNPDLYRGENQETLLSDQNIEALANTLVERVFSRWSELRNDIDRAGVDLGI